MVETVALRPLPERDYEADFQLQPGETLAGVFAFSATVAEQTEAIVAEIGDLDHPVPVPRCGAFPGSPTTSSPGRCAGCCST